MKLSAKTEYACLAMLELAKEYDSGEPVQLRRIAAEHGIPARFLVQILLQLKGASLVASTRGAAGGYRLARPPQEITLADVIDVMEGDDRLDVERRQEVAAGAGFARFVPRSGRTASASGSKASRWPTWWPRRPSASRCISSENCRIDDR